MIGGPNSSGKTTLLHLLDGPENFINLHHEKILNLYQEFFLYNQLDIINDFIRIKFSKKKKFVKIKSKFLNKFVYMNIQNFKKKIYNTSFSILEDAAFYNQAPSHFSTKSFYESKSNKFIFNFQKFDQEIKKKIFNGKKNFFFEEIIDIYYESYLNNWKTKKKNKFKNVIFKTANETKHVKEILKELKNSKYIYIKRNILGLIKSRALFKFSRDKNLKRKKNINYFFLRILFSNFIEKIKSEYDRIDDLKFKFKKKIYVSSLEKIIYETSSEMKNILNFLNLEKKRYYFSPSYNGFFSNKEHIKKINDDEVVIADHLINLCKLRINGLSYYKIEPKKFSLKNLFIYFYIKIKNFINY